MNYQEHFKELEEKYKNPIKGIPLKFPQFSHYYPYFIKGERILLGADTGVGKTTISIKIFIMDVIDYVLSHPEVDTKIYYFSIENSRSIIISKIYQYLLFKKGIKLSLRELFNPSLQSTLDHIKSLHSEMDKIQERLMIIDSLKNPSAIYNYMEKEMTKYGTLINTPEGIRFKENNINMYLFCIVDTINALSEDPGLDQFKSIKKWSENYSKLKLGQLYNVVTVNIQQFDNEVKTNQYSSMGMRVEEKHEPTLGNFATVKTTPQDHTVVFSLFQPHRYSLSTYKGFSISVMKEHYIRLNVMKNNFGVSGGEISANLYFEPEGGEYEELPLVKDKASLDSFLSKKGLTIYGVVNEKKLNYLI